ncbi:MAG TPA: ATP-dependent DNA helicase [Candidatus Nanoarchaeia archaeon]|nr:ATP-dependent DNA helicase [Candidatus Nanoarchaeia archaeon]
MAEEELENGIYFPYSEIRNIQKDMVSDIYNALKNKKSIILHAPTGIGKTAAALAPAVHHAMKNKLTVFFLTSRQTQHKIVVETLRQIKKKFGIPLVCADIIGKRNMCLQSSVEVMQAGSFHDYCKSLREENKCEFYINARKPSGQPTLEAKKSVEELNLVGPSHVQDFIEEGKKCSLCPYELATISASGANVIIADYYYIFNAPIRNSFFSKIQKNLENSILIVDEAHNLPTRVRDLLTQKTSSLVIEFAKKEARKFGYIEAEKNLDIVENALFEASKDIENESTISKNLLIDLVNKNKNYESIISELGFFGEDIQRQQKKSFILSVAKFLDAWQGPDIGFGRILSKEYGNKLKVSLSYRCLDPSISIREITQKCQSSIMMSGTLTPTSMYKDILGFDSSVIEKEYKSPFPKKNRLNLVVPLTTTRFSERNNRQYSQIAKVCSEVCNLANGSSAVFFPSYDLLLNVYEYMKDECKKPIFSEKQKSTKEEKENLIESFKKHQLGGAVLLGISTGSFGEGIDMPGVLKSVIVVGLPLQKPDAEAKLMIEYYDDKFGKGLEYGYIMPAITKCLQNAGRCIRSESDKGAIIFLDERYAQGSYYNCFPDDWDVEVEVDYESTLKEFFGREGNGLN